jgi:hypothetical protein
MSDGASLAQTMFHVVLGIEVSRGGCYTAAAAAVQSG